MAYGTYSETVNMQGPPWLGELLVPQTALGLVLCARHSNDAWARRRCQRAVEVLHLHGLASLTFDLVSAEEADDQHTRLNPALLARRMDQVLDWVERRADLRGYRLGLFAASTAAAAAMRVAAERPLEVAAVVAQGRGWVLDPDSLSPAPLQAPAPAPASTPAQIQVPTLLFVDASDAPTLAHSRALLRRLGGPKRLEVVPQAAPGIDEPASQEGVLALAAGWFERHLRPRPVA